MAAKKIPSTSASSTSLNAAAAESENDAGIVQQLEEQLKSADIEDGYDSTGSSISSASSTTASVKLQANTLSAAEQEIADQDMLRGVRVFFENDFIQAQRIFSAQDQFNPIFALGTGALSFIKACMTFNESDIQNAINTLQHAESLCNSQIHAVEKKSVPLISSVSKLVSSGWGMFSSKGSNPKIKNGHLESGTPKYMTNGEIRARVIRAECLLLTSLILLFQESIMSYLKAGLNLRKGYKSYETVWEEIQSMGDQATTLVDNNTLGGVHYGLGTINIVLASLPTKILRVISSFGYVGDKTFGFDLVSKCIAGKGVRSPLGSLMFLGYYTILAGFAPAVLGEKNIPIADKILKDALHDFKESAFFLYFDGRNSRLKGMIKESNASFELASSKATTEWGSELKRMCDYELGLNCALSLQWEEAAVYFNKLVEENYWSKAFFLYFKAACIEESGKKEEAISIYRSISGLVGRKFGGRTILVEQYVARKLKLFEQTGFEDTNLPTLEILLIWNGFSSMSQESLTACLAKVDAQIGRIRDKNSLDNIAVLKTLKGTILHQLGRHKEGTESLNWVVELNSNKIHEEKWVIPFACWEAGVGCWIEDKNLTGDQRWARARSYWDKAAGFSGYEFEFRLSVRIHTASMHIQDLSK
ncbi:tetratricopeptide repeat domain 39A [Mortierella sp. AD011]|nr:tetratricopeptide repeat domain 39A [Mortierella sp. AD010]KAF9398954.1 tetratricopeptide repeat domain 39A [Mortierella sp. AD011]